MKPRAVLIDALGTLLALQAPAPALRALLRERFGVEVTERHAAEAISAEIAYYRLHLAEGRDAASVAELRARCALVLRDALALGPALDGAGPDDLLALLLDALVFTPFPDVRPALLGLRAAELRLVVVSNWDASLPQTLARTGLLDLLDGVVCSAACGAAKPDPQPFAAALRLANAGPAEAVHVGDSLVEDVEGALRAGVMPVLLVRDESRGDGPASAPAGIASIASLAELPALLDGLATVSIPEDGSATDAVALATNPVAPERVTR